MDDYILFLCMHKYVELKIMNIIDENYVCITYIQLILRFNTFNYKFMFILYFYQGKHKYITINRCEIA